MRISDWSSDVCSSDLALEQHLHRVQGASGQPVAHGQRTSQGSLGTLAGGREMVAMHCQDQSVATLQQAKAQVGAFSDDPLISNEQIGRASCRERVCQYG